MIFVAITTLSGHVSRALDFYSKNNIFFSIGRTQPWENEQIPPTPINTDTTEDVQGYKLVDSKFLVVPVLEEGKPYEISYRGTRWKIIAEGDAVTLGARWVYIMSFIEYEEFPIDMVYRQIGVYTRLVRAEGVPPGKANLLPSEVLDPGILEVIDNRKPTYRELDQREKLAVVIEF